ncbi:MAG: helix-turn-helix transcriptional regulator [Bacteroidales bacterium]|nr:helix-turn-helix transcriptional regulator [Bacteroidales bacterium]
MRITTTKERIREILNYYNIKQAEFCKRTGIKSSALTNYLKGEREPRQDKVSQIADAFGLDPAWVMGYDVPMKKKIETTDRLLLYYRLLSELMPSDQELVFNQIDYLKERGKKNEKDE